ncbi:HTH_XRE domain containing protein [uncultured Caudovirales phage]|uniref:HTH_XRE domain containing protein n=1 Tax=uncultured Caudovirales phage TaxID=2100421 RepID=A0A6J5M2Z4_9CAUD|nr:HTH_XRE domain containing protein [uncultured Caudovirales phage]
MTGEKKIRLPIVERTREAREKAGLDGPAMAARLGIDYGKYNKYETRSSLPHDLLIKFCRIASVNIEWLLEGTGPRDYVDYAAEIASIQERLNSLQSN